MQKFSIHFFLLSSIVLSSLNTFAQNTCFTSLSDYSFTGISTVRATDNGDFNNDGNLDVVFATYTTGTTNQASITLGNGDGSFGAPTNFTCNQRIQDIKAYDFNGDGNLDIVAASNNTGEATICLGNGLGGFAAPVDYLLSSTTSGPNGVDIADINEDGFVDLVVSNQSSSSGFHFLAGNGDGTFDAAVQFSMGTAPRDVIVGDFNEDGNLDVATTNNSSANVSIRLGTGTGTFGAATNFSVAAQPVYIKAADINGDSHLDLVVSCLSSNTISLLVGTGTGSFSATDNYAVSGSPYEVIVNDFDENGDLDVAVVCNADNTVALLKGSGVNTAGSRFMTVVKFPVFGSPHTMIDGDYDEDTHVDLLVPAQSGTSRFLVMLGTGTGSFNTGTNIATGTSPNAVVIANFNGDSNTDLVVANKNSSNISYFSGNGDGTYAAGITHATGTNPVSVFAIDINHDGFIDVITANSAVHTISVLLGNGAGGFSAATSFATGGLVPSDLFCADFNNDTHIDVVVSHETSNDVGILLGDGAGNFGSATIFAVGTTPKAIIADNFNTTDTNLDIAVANNGSNNITVWFGDGTGSFSSSSNFTTSTGPIALDSKDMNGDSKSDIVVACNTGTRVSVLRATGTNSFLAKIDYTTDLLPQSICIRDFNNDGHPDVATANKVATGSTGSVSLFMGSSTAALGAKTDFATSTNSIGIASGLINSDALFDLAVVNFDANNVSILLNNTAVITASGATTFCSGNSVTLTASSGTDYLWSNSATTSAINVTTSGTYTVTISNLSGLCSSTSNGVTVTVNPNPTITTITGSTTICSSASTSLTAVGSTGTLDIDWYDAAVGGTMLSSTASYTTPTLTATTSYYVYAIEPSTGCQTTPRFEVIVTVGDAIAPVITGMPSNITLSAGASCNAVATWTAPSATDNCSTPSLSTSHAIGSTFPLGTTTVTYTATDALLNSSTASFTVTVNDNTDPVISGMPSNITTTVTAGTCAKTVTWTAPSASDNCSLASLVPSHTSGSSFPVGTTTVTYTATDASGNDATASFTITVNDNELPVISGMPSNMTLSATTGTCGAVATWTSPSANDNCGISTFTGSSTSGSTFPVGVTTVTYTATDVNGNIATSSFTITVNDTQNPTLSGMPSNMTVNTSTSSCSATVTWTPPIAADNCGVMSLTTTNSPGSSFPTGTTTVTYTVTDVNGNMATASFNVTVSDNVLPTYTGFPSNMSVSATAGTCSATATWTSPTPNDNCGVASSTSSSTSGSTFPVGVTTVTYTLTDINGNVNTQSFNITVLDTEAPTMIGCPGTQTVCEGSTVTYTAPTASDNCSGVSVAQIAGLPSGSVFPVGTTLCTFRATDASGNITNCNFNVIVNANPSTPTLVIPTSIDTVCDDNTGVALSGGSPSGGAYSGPGVAAGIFNAVTAGIGSHTITYTVTNGFGCSSVATDVIIVDNCLGFDDLANDKTVKLYPNPNNGVFTLEISGEALTQVDQLYILNQLGEIVYTERVIQNKTSLDLSTLARGIYLLRAGGYTQQFIIQR